MASADDAWIIRASSAGEAIVRWKGGGGGEKIERKKTRVDARNWGGLKYAHTSRGRAAYNVLAGPTVQYSTQELSHLHPDAAQPTIVFLEDNILYLFFWLFPLKISGSSGA